MNEYDDMPELLPAGENPSAGSSDSEPPHEFEHLAEQVTSIKEFERNYKEDTGLQARACPASDTAHKANVDFYHDKLYRQTILELETRYRMLVAAYERITEKPDACLQDFSESVYEKMVKTSDELDAVRRHHIEFLLAKVQEPARDAK